MNVGPYVGGAALRRALNHQIGVAARERDLPAQRIRRDFAHQRLLARVFSDDPYGWVLKGGVSLLVRLPTQARHSRDIDLVREDQVDLAVAALRRAAGIDLRDGFGFDVGTPRPGGRDAVVVPVVARIGATRFEGFPIDLLCRRQLPSEIERTKPQPILDLDYIPPLPPFALYPLAAQIADKVCAIYEQHGPTGTPSTRYRDLVDLVLIATTHSVAGEAAAAAIDIEHQRRDRLSLPTGFTFPEPRWRDGYRAAAHDARLASGLTDPDRARALMTAFLDPLLRGDAVMEWDPKTLTWTTAPDAGQTS